MEKQTILNEIKKAVHSLNQLNVELSWGAMEHEESDSDSEFVVPEYVYAKIEEAEYLLGSLIKKAVKNGIEVASIIDCGVDEPILYL